MEKAGYRHCAIVFVLMMLTGIALLFGPSGPVIGRAPVRLHLPETAAGYLGTDLLFCQEESCMAEFHATGIPGQAACPECGGRLDAITLAEKRLLPHDTVILKKRYVAPDGRSVLVSIVLSGRQQKSIHRAQQCLPSQGYLIEGSSILDVPLSSREPLKVALLDLRSAQGTPGRGRRPRLSCFAYWFAASDTETPYHLQRLFWMSRDRIFGKVIRRWAYISVSTGREHGSDRHVRELSSFIAELYPLLVAERPPPDSRRKSG